MKKPKLIEEWRSSWRFYSTHIAALNSSLLLTYLALPEKLQDALPPTVVISVAVLLLALGFGARLISQKRSR